MQALQHFVVNDWYFAIPMFTMSLIAIALVIWRILLNMNAKTNVDRFWPEFQATLQKGGLEPALKMCRAETGIIPKQLLTAGLEAHRQGAAAMRRSMANAIELEILPRLNFLLAPILAIAKIATMVGLLGTVISMINTFNEIAKAQAEGGVSGQAESIGLALFATALGLMTAIPLVFAHVLFKDWIARFEVQMKSAAQKLLGLMQNFKPPAAKSAASSATPASARPVTQPSS